MNSRFFSLFVKLFDFLFDRLDKLSERFSFLCRFFFSLGLRYDAYARRNDRKALKVTDASQSIIEQDGQTCLARQ